MHIATAKWFKIVSQKLLNKLHCSKIMQLLRIWGGGEFYLLLCCAILVLVLIFFFFLQSQGLEANYLQINEN